MEIVIYRRQRVDYGEQNDTTFSVPKLAFCVTGPSEFFIQRFSIERSRTASPGAVLQRANSPGVIQGSHHEPHQRCWWHAPCSVGQPAPLYEHWRRSPSYRMPPRSGVLVLLPACVGRRHRARISCWASQEPTGIWGCRGYAAYLPQDEWPQPDATAGKRKNSEPQRVLCLHSVVWSRCPKIVFVGHHKLHGAVASAVSASNTEACQLTDLMRRMATEINEVTLAYVEDRTPSQYKYRLSQVWGFPC